MKDNAVIFREKSLRIEKELVKIGILRDKAEVFGLSVIKELNNSNSLADDLEKYSVSVRVIGGDIGVIYRDGQKEIDDIVRYSKVDENIVDIIDALREDYYGRIRILNSFFNSLPFKVINKDFVHVKDFFDKVRTLRQSVSKIRVVSEYYFERFIRSAEVDEGKLSDIEKEKISKEIGRIEFIVSDADIENNIKIEIDKRIETVKIGIARNNRASVIGALMVLLAFIGGIADFNVAAENIKGILEYILDNTLDEKEVGGFILDFKNI